MANACGFPSIGHRALAGDEASCDLTKSSSREGDSCDRRGALLTVAPGPSALTHRDIPGIGRDLRKRDGQRFRRILVAYDGSPQAERAVEIAFSLARLATSRVMVLVVMKPAEPDDSADFQAELYSTRKRFEHSFAAMQEQARGSEIGLKTRMIVGNPAAEIVNRAEIMLADLIIMGRHSKSVIRRWVLGSNSDRVIENARRPVMLVH